MTKSLSLCVVVCAAALPNLLGSSPLRCYAQGPLEEAQRADAATASDLEASGADGARQDLAASYNHAIQELRDVAVGSIDPCLHAIYIAATDRNVAAILLRNLGNSDYLYMGVRCIEGPGIPEQQRVLFDFDCRPGVFCLVEPNVLVVVDVIQRRVVSVIDPYPHGGVAPGIRHVLASIAEDGESDVERRSITTQGLRFKIGNELNPPIRVDRGDTVEITFTGSGHDWTLDYVQNGSPQQIQATNGQTVTFTAELAGEFEYYCSVGTHRQQGMKGAFIVDP